jgi:16S rRNA (adenine1518-N6/adenine1519-N6)-dimethyltransferase
MQTLSEIKALLESRGLAPRKSLGQNFLIDHNLIRKLVDASGVGPGDPVLEIGPGTGTLTEELLARGCEVIAVELDRGLAELLRERLATAFTSTFTLIEGDALDGKRAVNQQAIRALAGRPFRLVANLPYGAGTPVLLALLTNRPECSGMFVTIQREVADRLLAGSGSRDYGAISVVAQALCHISRIAVLPPECFWPRPEVTSTMLALTRRADPLTANPAGLAAFAQELFGKRRKQLGSILGRPAPDRPWPAGIRPDQRAEELSVAQFVALAAESDRL